MLRPCATRAQPSSHASAPSLSPAQKTEELDSTDLPREHPPMHWARGHSDCPCPPNWPRGSPILCACSLARVLSPQRSSDTRPNASPWRPANCSPPSAYSGHSPPWPHPAAPGHPPHDHQASYDMLPLVPQAAPFNPVEVAEVHVLSAVCLSAQGSPVNSMRQPSVTTNSELGTRHGCEGSERVQLTLARC
jgi:hypothetical protein